MQGLFRFVRALLPVVLLVVLAGCITANKVWPERVGHYTYDQAVIELGPPDKQAKLDDGTLVADWLIRHGYNYTQVSPGIYRSYCYSAVPIITQNYAPDYFLRLVFGPDGKLQSWKDYAR